MNNNNKDPRNVKDVNDIDLMEALSYYICSECDQLKYLNDIIFMEPDNYAIIQLCKDCHLIKHNIMYKEKCQKRLAELKDYMETLKDLCKYCHENIYSNCCKKCGQHNCNQDCSCY